MKHWRDKKRWYDEHHVRVSRLFRAHVNTRKNPRGRIFRMLCQWCPANSQTTSSQFHHISYEYPFVGVWVCTSHHRQLEAGTIVVTPAKVLDYTPLVRPILRPATSAAMRELAKEKKSTGEEPF